MDEMATLKAEYLSKATGIEENKQAATYVSGWHNLQGMRIEKPTKPGIYIKDGKKVAIGM